MYGGHAVPFCAALSLHSQRLCTQHPVRAPSLVSATPLPLTNLNLNLQTEKINTHDKDKKHHNQTELHRGATLSADTTCQ
jgi:hypothetical protein